MENATLPAVQGWVVDPARPRTRLSAIVVAVALVAATFVVAARPADASPVRAPVAAAVAAPVAGSAVSAQIQFGQFVCPILLAVRNAFASSPFFSFVVAAINPLLIRFGCIPS